MSLFVAMPILSQSLIPQAAFAASLLGSIAILKYKTNYDDMDLLSHSISQDMMLNEYEEDHNMKYINERKDSIDIVEVYHSDENWDEFQDIEVNQSTIEDTKKMKRELSRMSFKSDFSVGLNRNSSFR